MSLNTTEGPSPTVEGPPTPPANTNPATAVEGIPAAADETAETVSVEATISIDPLEEDTDTDSAFGEDNASTTSSIASSIRRYRNLHGRTYHNFNTESSSEYCDFADQFPSAEVIGVDISPTQPTFTAPNVKFELDDVQLEWTYQPNSFDYIHVRCMLGAIQDWAHLYREIYKCTKPGGYIEHLEISIMFKSEDGTVTEDHFMAQWSKILLGAAEKIGKTFAIYDFNREMITQAGFVDVVEKKYKVPVGTWPRDPKMKELGQWNLLFCLEGLESWSLYLLSMILKWSYEEIQVHIATMRNHLLNRRNHAYYDMYILPL
ncbi:hypothetical protein AA0113_g8709 [Alternaria arborescens]|uniref:Methyltransferase type 11 domain-containing protein n=1 Tax=Alternaria arborescens TaxID=156630 RepID=A0A4Q4RFZ7_9PLEO|nr:hypothetical protein AA0113_g8709 [Alternaria arborescens]